MYDAFTMKICKKCKKGIDEVVGEAMARGPQTFEEHLAYEEKKEQGRHLDNLHERAVPIDWYICDDCL